MEEALPTLKPDRIAGVGGLSTRHDSMAAGEAGADYVLFGEPDAQRQRPSVEAIAERLQWWAELFEPPCVGFAGVARGSLRICRGRRGFRSGRRFHLGRSARRGGGADGGRAGDPAGACREVRKSQSRAGIAPEMKIPRPISILAGCLMLTAGARRRKFRWRLRRANARRRSQPAAQAQSQNHLRSPGSPRRPPRRRKPEQLRPRRPRPSTPAPVPDDPNVDLVYGAYQRGQYKTAFDLATKRVQENGDPKAMTMLGELYANGDGRQARLCARQSNGTSAPPTGATARPCSRWRCFVSPDAAARPIARKPRNCWRPRPSSASRRRPIIWRCSISTGRPCRRT